MARSEQELISLCKKQIEEKLSFGNGHAYTQRDLELLSGHIQEKTDVVISLSTLKRLWKDDYKQSPQLATLNALASILGHKDWQDFKMVNQKSPNSKSLMLKWAVPVAVLLIIIWISVFGFSFKFGNPPKDERLKRPPKINGPVHFNASKTVASGIPNTVIFKYDVTNVVADSFYIQQSWNDDHKVRIDPLGSAVTSIYYESGFHRAKLIANDSVIAMQPVHIISNGWEPHIYRSDSNPELIDLKNEKFISQGQLHLDSGMLNRRGLDFSKKFHTRITNSQAFGVHSDNFILSTRIKTDRVLHNLCAGMDLIIVTDVKSFMVSLTDKGCEKYAAYQLGEILKQGKNNDLSMLGCDVYNWQEVEIRVKNRHATIYLNGKSAYEEVYQENFGKIVALIYIFDGKGSIDYTRLKDGNGQTVFEDDFENKNGSARY